MNTEVENEPEDQVLEEFKRRITQERYVRFEPRSDDITFRKNEDGISATMGMFFKYVLAPMPIEFVNTVFTMVKSLFGAIIAAFLALFLTVFIPVTFVVRRLFLFVGAITGRLDIEPHDESIVRHVNNRIIKVRNEMKRDGYDISNIETVDRSQLTPAARKFLLRGWRQNPSDTSP